jgi:hypothetical protein
VLPAGDYARSGYSLPENHPPDIFEDNIFPGIWTKVFERPSNRYLEGDFYIVYVRDRVLVLFQKILSLFTIYSDCFKSALRKQNNYSIMNEEYNKYNRRST